eukprot:s1774_g11.t1
MDPGIPRINAEVLRKACVENRGFELPELNEVLILHYRGFRKIENLDEYHNVRSIFLECNGISKIENLEVMPHLVSLYLQSNCITRMENLDLLSNLQYLNLSHNSISEVQNLRMLSMLDTLNLAANKFEDVEKLKGLSERPTLRSVDVSSNYFEDGDALVNFWESNLPNVQCLYIHHNPCSRALKDSRRRLISRLPKLRWIDERPVTAIERAGCEAWAVGGKEAEMEAKHAHWLKEKEEKDAWCERSFQNFRRVQQAHAERAKAQKEAQARRDAARDQAQAALQETGMLNDGFVLMPERSAAAEVESVEVVETKNPEAKDDEVDAVESEAVPEVTPVEGVQEVEEEPEDAVVETVEDVGPFEWTGFKDRCLGRLVAEHRYNFKKASAALSKEFACEVSEQECRQRYGELCRPSQQTAGNRQEATRKSIQEGAGRAADGPPPDAAAVKEVSQWFVRRIRQGNGQAVAGGKKPKATECQDENPMEDEDPVVQNENPVVRHPMSSEAQSLMALSGSMLFSPPPRQPLDPIQLQNQELNPEMPKVATVQRPVAVSKCAEEQPKSRPCWQAMAPTTSQEWSSISIPPCTNSAGASPTKMVVTLDSVAATLEKDLEDERRERREQVAFLNRICAKERELLVGRAESFQRQFAEAKELWDRERALLQDRIHVSETAIAASNRFSLERAEEKEVSLQRQISDLRQSEQSLEAQVQKEQSLREDEAKRWSPTITELHSNLAELRTELDTSKKESAAKIQELTGELQSCQAQRDNAAGAFKEVLSKQAACEAEAVAIIRQEASEQRALLLSEANAEVQALRGEVHNLQQENEKLKREVSAKSAAWWEARAEIDEQVARLRTEYEEESQESLTKAVHQLQVADDLVVGLRRRSEQESDARAMCLREFEAAKQEAAEEAACCRRLLAANESRSEKVPQSFRSDLSRGSDQMNEIYRERQEAMAIMERLRSRHVPEEPTSELPWPKIGSIGSSPMRCSPGLRGARDMSWLSSAMAAASDKDFSGLSVNMANQ